jgi:hypothetical protein
VKKNETRCRATSVFFTGIIGICVADEGGATRSGEEKTMNFGTAKAMSGQVHTAAYVRHPMASLYGVVFMVLIPLEVEGDMEESSRALGYAGVLKRLLWVMNFPQKSHSSCGLCLSGLTTVRFSLLWEGLPDSEARLSQLLVDLFDSDLAAKASISVLTGVILLLDGDVQTFLCCSIELAVL